MGFNLDDPDYFPTFSELPDENELDLRYYSDPFDSGSGVASPVKHWCLLVEVIRQIPWIRPMFMVKDGAGQQFLVAFHLDSDQPSPKEALKHAKPGNMMSIMYAEQHFFMDGQHGIRLEGVKTVKTYPCSLETFVGLGDRVNSFKAGNQKCQTCDADASLQCSSCSMVKYCSKECQTQDWRRRHKSECLALKQINNWKQKNWGNFWEYW